MQTDPPLEARVALPNWLWGGNPQGLLAKSDYHSRRAPDGVSYLLRPMDAYLGKKPDLVRLRPIAVPGRAPQWRELARLVERVEIPKLEQLSSAIERRRKKAESSGELGDLITYHQLLLYDSPVEGLPLQAERFLSALNDVQFSNAPSETPFPRAGLHVVEVNPVLVHRLKFPSIWLRIEQDARLGKGDVAHIQRLGAADAGQAFDSSSGLYSGVMIFDAYLGPLLAAGSPGIWAVSVARTFGSLVFNLGTFISGTAGEAAELLQLINIPGAQDVIRFSTLSRNAADNALTWWMRQLNLLFSTLSDLATFTDVVGDYRPAKHLESLLSVEQIFRRTTSMLLSHRDTNARRTLLFTILDSLEGVRGTNFLTMCTLSHARKTLNGLEETLPLSTLELLLPAARRAVKALEALQEGFFIRRQLGTERVVLQLDGITSRELSPEDAAARYLKILRDATHGHGADKDSAKAMTDALLAHHNGDVPHDIGLLGYLYLMDLLANPERVRQRLYRSGR